MKILAVSYDVPHPDKSSGDLRFFTLLSLLARKQNLLFCALNPADCSVLPCNSSSSRLEQVGVTMGSENLYHVLKYYKPDVILFEFYHQAHPNYLKLIQRYSPHAQIVVDSVDVHFNRLEAKARLTGKPEDEIAARQVKLDELTAYASADLVIAVCEDDRQLIRHALPDKPIEVIPNVHAMPAYPDSNQRRHGELVFIGGFKHDPNVDAMLYFCRDVMPLISTACPESRLKIIGSNPPLTIQALANENVEVLGYVEETAPFLKSAYISVAPLRYGGGMKGKVGEAMSYGLPVVTTSCGAEGFGVQPGEDLLIGDTADSFAAQVIALLNDSDLHDRIAHNGYHFIEQHYSVPVVDQLLDSAMRRLTHLPKHTIPLSQRLTMVVQDFYTQHVAWRLKKL